MRRTSALLTDGRSSLNIIANSFQESDVLKITSFFENHFEQCVSSEKQVTARRLDQFGYLEYGMISRSDGRPNPLEGWSIPDRFHNLEIGPWDAEVSAAILRLRQRMSKLSHSILDNFFSNEFQIPKEISRELYNGFLYALNYPQRYLSNDDKFLQDEHCDTSIITIFLHQTAKGLEVLSREKWVPVTLYPPDCMVAVGSAMENLSNEVQALRHRVVPNGSDTARLSFVYFVEFDEENFINNEHLSSDRTQKLIEHYRLHAQKRRFDES